MLWSVACVLAAARLAASTQLAGTAEECDGGSSAGASENVALLQERRQQRMVPLQTARKANRTRRGQPAGHIAALDRTQSSSAFQVNEDGVWKTYFLPGATILDERTLQYGVNDKYFLMKSDTTDSCSASNFEMLKLAGKTFSASVYLNGAGCGCNVNFFLVAMPASSPGEYGDCYCDANCVGGNCCNEFDLNEMNTHAVQVTNHLCGDPPTHDSCDAAGSPVLNFSPTLFGPGNANTIDTEHPFNYSVQFQEFVYSQDNPDNHLVVLVTIQQGDKVVSNTMANGALNGMWPQLKSGMVLVFDYWESSDMTWLDGASCQAPSDCSGNKAEVSNIHITTNA